MELNMDALQVVWRNIPALIMVLTGLVQLVNELSQQRRLAKNFNIYPTHKQLPKRRK